MKCNYIFVNKSHGLVWMAMTEVWHQCSNVFPVTCQSMVSCVLIGSHFNCSLQSSEKLNSRPAHYILPAIISPMVIWSHGFLWGLVAMVPPVTVWIPLNSGRTQPPVSCQLFWQMSPTTFGMWPYKLPIHAVVLEHCSSNRGSLCSSSNHHLRMLLEANHTDFHIQMINITAERAYSPVQNLFWFQQQIFPPNIDVHGCMTHPLKY